MIQYPTISENNLVKIIIHASLGSDSSFLLMIYKTLIRNIPDYDSIQFNFGNTICLNMFQTKLNTSIRLSNGSLNPASLTTLKTSLIQFRLTLDEKKRKTISILLCQKQKQHKQPSYTIHKYIYTLKNKI